MTRQAVGDCDLLVPAAPVSRAARGPPPPPASGVLDGSPRGGDHFERVRGTNSQATAKVANDLASSEAGAMACFEADFEAWLKCI